MDFWIDKEVYIKMLQNQHQPILKWLSWDTSLKYHTFIPADMLAKKISLVWFGLIFEIQDDYIFFQANHEAFWFDSVQSFAKAFYHLF